MQSLHKWICTPLESSDDPDSSETIMVVNATRDVHSGLSFIGLIETIVLQSFLQTGLQSSLILEAIRAIIEGYEKRAGLLASKQVLEEAPLTLHKYASRKGATTLRLLTTVSNSKSKQVMFRDTIDRYLSCIEFADKDDDWPTELVLPVTAQPILRVRPDISWGDPTFINGGGPLTSMRNRFRSGETIKEIAGEYGVPLADVKEAFSNLWTAKQ